MIECCVPPEMLQRSVGSIRPVPYGAGLIKEVKNETYNSDGTTT